MRGTIKKRSENSWTLIFDLGTDAKGKRRQKWQAFHGTKREAEKELATRLSEIGRGTYVDPSRLSVADYLDQWLAQVATATTATTHEGYDIIVRKHLVPALGDTRLTKLSALQIEEYYRRALASGRRDGKGGLSARTVHHHHRVLHEALKRAVRLRLISLNPAADAEAPRPDAREIRTLTLSDTARLLRGAQGTRLHLPILLAVTTGLRRGEILGLRWTDLDLMAGTLSVAQAIEETRAHGVRIKRPKTKHSLRTIDLPALAVEALKRHKAEQAEIVLMAGPDYRRLDLVLATPDGEPWRPTAFTSAFRLLAARYGGPCVSFHALRHGHAEHQLALGVSAKIISDRLGHHSVGFTMDTYVGKIPNLQRDAADRVNAALTDALTAC